MNACHIIWTDNYIQLAISRHGTERRLNQCFTQHQRLWNKKPAQGWSNFLLSSLFLHPMNGRNNKKVKRRRGKKTEHQEIVSFYFVESFNEMVHLICLQKWSLWFCVRFLCVLLHVKSSFQNISYPLFGVVASVFFNTPSIWGTLFLLVCELITMQCRKYALDFNKRRWRTNSTERKF